MREISLLRSLITALARQRMAPLRKGSSGVAGEGSLAPFRTSHCLPRSLRVRFAHPPPLAQGRHGCRAGAKVRAVRRSLSFQEGFEPRSGPAFEA